MTGKARDAILPILLILALMAGCLGGNSDTTSTQPPLPPDTTPPPVYVRPTTPPPVTTQPTTTPPPAVTTTPPPVTTPPPTTAGPLTEEQIKEKIRQDLIGRQLSTTSGAFAYAVKPGDIRTFEPEILDGMPVWKVTVVASNTTFPYRWFAYYTTTGTLYRTHKQF